MKCTVCGYEMSPVDQVCSNCGTRKSEMQSTFNTATGPMPTSAYGDFERQKWQGSGKNSGNRGLVWVIILVIIGALAALFFLFGRPLIQKEQSFDGFSIKIPTYLKEVERESAEQGGIKLDMVEYADNRSDENFLFIYMKFDLTGLSDSDATYALDTLTDELMLSTFESTLSSTLRDFKKEGGTSSKLRFSCKNKSGKKLYGDMRIYRQDKVLYLMLEAGRNNFVTKKAISMSFDTLDFK